MGRVGLTLTARATCFVVLFEGFELVAINVFAGKDSVEEF